MLTFLLICILAVSSESEVSYDILNIFKKHHYGRVLKSICFSGRVGGGGSLLKLKMNRLKNLASFVIYLYVQIENDKYVELR